MGNIPVGVDTFQKDKNWDKVQFRSDKTTVLNTDLNEMQDIARYREWLRQSTTTGTDTRIGYGFQVQESPNNINNFDICSGLAVSYGNVVLSTSERVTGAGIGVFGYDPTNPNFKNRMFDGTVTSIDASTKKIIDSNKYFVVDHNLSKCRVYMTSGAESGNSFIIQGIYGAGWDTTSFVLNSLGSTGIAVGDSYIIVPPKLTTPAIGADTTVFRTDLVYLQTWYEDISDSEDPDMISEIFPVAQSGRTKSKWCVRVSEGYVDPVTNKLITGVLPTSSDSANPFSVHYLPLATISRQNGNPRVYDAQVTLYRGVELPLPALSQEVVDTRTSPRSGSYDSVPERIDALESCVADSKLVNGSFEIGSLVGSDIPGWTQSSTRWKITQDGAKYQSRCVVVDHTTYSTTANEYLYSTPFYVRPEQSLKFSARAKAVTAGATVQAILYLYSGTYTLDSTPVQTKTLSFISGTTDWQLLSSDVTTVSSAQWGRVVLYTSGQSASSVYFDDVRVEYFENPMNNTNITVPTSEIFKTTFNSGLLGWTVDAGYSGDGNVTINDSPKSISLVAGTSTGNVEIASWPISIVKDNFGDKVFVKCTANYSGVTGSGPYLNIKCYNDACDVVSSSNAKTYLSYLDYGSSSEKNPISPDNNYYCATFTIPSGVSFFTIQLGLDATAGSCTFSDVSAIKYGVPSQPLESRCYNDLVTNGEFGRLLFDNNTAVPNPLQGEFTVVGWDIYDDTTKQRVFCKKNTPSLAAPFGDRVISFDVAANEATVLSDGLSVTQTINRALTEQDYVNGFVADFDYSYAVSRTGAVAKFTVDFLDSDGTKVVPTYGTELTETASTLVTSWSRKTIGVAVPAATTSGGLTSYLQYPVYMRIGFVFSAPTGTSETVFNVSGVRLWGRTTISQLNTITTNQYEAMSGYYTADSTEGAQSEDFYETGRVVPSSTNRFLVQNDNDIMRYSRDHATNHLDTTSDINYLRDASTTQRGILSKEAYATFTQKLGKEDLLGIAPTGVIQGLYVDEYGMVYPGVAIDNNGNRLEITTQTQMTISTSTGTDQWRCDLIYLYYDATKSPTTQLALISSLAEQPSLSALQSDTVTAANLKSYMDGAYSITDQLLNTIPAVPSGGIPLAFGMYNAYQYTTESTASLEGDPSKFRVRWCGFGTPTIDSDKIYTYPDGYATYRTVRQWLINAQEVGTSAASETAPGVHYPNYDYEAISSADPVYPTIWIPKYEILDKRYSAFRVIAIQDSNLLMFYAIDPNTYGVNATPTVKWPYLSIDFKDVGNTTDVGWGDGEPLYGLMTHWEDFIATYLATVTRLDTSYVNGHLRLTSGDNTTTNGWHKKITVYAGSYGSIVTPLGLLGSGFYFEGSAIPIPGLLAGSVKSPYNGMSLLANAYADPSTKAVTWQETGDGYGIDINDTTGFGLLHSPNGETTANDYVTLKKIYHPDRWVATGSGTTTAKYVEEGGSKPGYTLAYNSGNVVTSHMPLDIPVGCIPTSFTICWASGSSSNSTIYLAKVLAASPYTGYIFADSNSSHHVAGTGSVDTYQTSTITLTSPEAISGDYYYHVHVDSVSNDTMHLSTIIITYKQYSFVV